MSCDSDKRKCKLGCLPGYRLQSSSRRLTSSAWNRAEGREEERGEQGGVMAAGPGAGRVRVLILVCVGVGAQLERRATRRDRRVMFKLP